MFNLVETFIEHLCQAHSICLDVTLQINSLGASPYRQSVGSKCLNGWTGTPATGLNICFSLSRDVVFKRFHLRVSLKGPLRPAQTDRYTKTHTQSRTSTISPPGAAKAASRHWARGGDGGGEGERGRGKRGTKKAEAARGSYFSLQHHHPRAPSSHPHTNL